MLLSLGNYCFYLCQLPVLPFYLPNHFFCSCNCAATTSMKVVTGEIGDGGVNVRWASIECESVAGGFMTSNLRSG